MIVTLLLLSLVAYTWYFNWCKPGPLVYCVSECIQKQAGWLVGLGWTKLPTPQDGTGFLYLAPVLMSSLKSFVTPFSNVFREDQLIVTPVVYLSWILCLCVVSPEGMGNGWYSWSTLMIKNGSSLINLDRSGSGVSWWGALMWGKGLFVGKWNCVANWCECLTQLLWRWGLCALTTKAVLRLVAMVNSSVAMETWWGNYGNKEWLCTNALWLC